MTFVTLALHQKYRQTMGRRDALKAVVRDLKAQFPECRIGRAGVEAILTDLQPEGGDAAVLVTTHATGGAVRFGPRPTFRKRGQHITPRKKR